MKSKRIAIVGAGPIGLEAALYAAQLGYQVDVFEKGQVGSHLIEWGHVTLFSSWEMNHTSLGLALLKNHCPTFHEPSPNAYLTGTEHLDTYLRPLSQLPQISTRIHGGLRVEAIGRQQLLKGDLVGDLSRSNNPFRILTSDLHGIEKMYKADIVIDASGVYDSHNWLGEGGIPAIGERRNRDLIDYKLPDVYGKDRSRFAGRKTLLVGSGFSAATTACDFQNLIREEPKTTLVWATQSERSLPIPEIEEDPLPNRKHLTETANALAENSSSQIEFRNRTNIVAITWSDSTEKFQVKLKKRTTFEIITVDRIIANVGYRPDNSIYRELQVHECYATSGPMKLAAALLGSASGDCLAQTSMGANTLRNPEPNFFIIGNKSYGRNSTFLLRVGFSQIVEVFSLITGDPNLNLYQGR
ncbi:NAD(P)-binding domain-containing protein [bacterium]|nr:NAD(P)-binding domain-containing protein [bacterium]